MPAGAVQLGSSLYYVASDAQHGAELWKSDLDGSNAAILKDINPGTYSSIISSLTVMSNTLFFAAETSNTGIELFKSDGTAQGTVLVKDIYVGSASSSPAKLTVVDGTLFFTARQAALGTELFKSDGTADGTLLVKDILPGYKSSDPQNLLALSGRVIFLGTTDQGVGQLFSSDGTADGTVQLYPTGPASTVSNLRVAGGFAYFDARRLSDDHFDQLQTDGTVAGTMLVPDAGIWVVNGTAGDDDVQISDDGTVTTIDVGGVAQTRDDSTFKSIELHLGDGNDKVSVAGGFAFPLAIYGEAGNDSIIGGQNNDTLVGGDGDDWIDASSGGNDTLVGGAGNDTIDYSKRVGGVHSFYQGTNQYQNLDLLIGHDGENDRFDGFESLLGSQDDDSIYLFNRATDVNHIVFVDAHAGNDFIYLFAQTPIAPTVHGGLGNDKIEMTDARVFDYPEDSGFNINFAALPGFVYGDAGDDVLIAGNSGNDFYGGDGFDKIDYSKVTWRYYSWDHYRWLVDVTSRGVTVSLDNQTNDGPRGLENAHSDIEELIGSPAGDLLTASAGPTTILGGTGNDMLVGDNNDSLDGGAGANTITMGRASLSNGLLKILGSDHDDLIIVRRKLNDTTNLEILFDRLMIAATFKLADVTFIQIDAKAGNDRIEFDQTNGPLVLRTKIYGGAGNDVIYGSAGADQIHGGDGNDWISAGDGNDNVYGEAGNDRLFGGDGNDYLDGGSGTDMIRGDGGIDRIVATMALDDYTKNRGDVLILSN